MINLLQTLASSYSYTTTTTMQGSSLGSLFMLWLILAVLTIFFFIIPLWKIYVKAGRRGWAAIIPIYNNWVLFEIVGYPGWWSILSLIPFVNIFPAIMTLVAYFKLAKLFGKSSLFGVMLILFPFICLPILAFGNATFHGGGTTNSGMPPQQSSVAPTATSQAISPTPMQPAAMPVVQPQQVVPATPPEQGPTAPQPPVGPVVG